MKKFLPNALTLLRIALIPVVVLLLLWDTPYARLYAALVFLLASLTDFLDGYLARMWSEMSLMGRVLDPVADKLLVAACLLVLTAMHVIEGWALLPALIILCREILVSGLREFLIELQVRVPVAPLAKWKTAVQMAALVLLIAGNIDDIPLQEAGIVALWVAAVLTLMTGYEYCKAGFVHIKRHS